MNQIDLKDRRAVVTGAAQGIGLSITQRLLASGAHVCLWDQDATLLAETCKVLAESPVSSEIVDVTDSLRWRHNGQPLISVVSTSW